jgi:hypothetical protein
MLRRALEEEAEARHAVNAWANCVAEIQEQQRAVGDKP